MTVKTQDLYFPNTDIICLEGLDCAGKETISKLLKEYYEKSDTYAKVMIVSFPDYEANDVLSTILHDKDTTLLTEVNYHTCNTITETCRFFVINIMNKLSKINSYINREYKALLREGKESQRFLLILDRYWFSNLWYQCTNKEDYERLIDLKTTYHLPKVKYTFYLKYPLEITKYLLTTQRGKDMDAYEEDNDFLSQVYNRFEDNQKEISYIISKHSSNFKIINGIKSTTIDTDKTKRITIYTDIKTPEEIAKQIRNFMSGDKDSDKKMNKPMEETK